MFEWYMTRHVVENGHQKCMWYNEMGLCAQIDSLVNIIERVYVIILKRERIFSVTFYKFCI